MSRSIIFDVTPFARMSVENVGGVDRLAFAYGRHFAQTPRPDVWGAYYGALAPHLVTADGLKAILRNTEHAWRDDIAAEADPGLAHIFTWLGAPQSYMPTNAPPARRRGADRARRFAFHARYWLSGAARPLPRNAIYLNVFNSGREHHFLFDWLKRRSEVRAVFFVHDLLPLDYPEYFRPNSLRLSERRLATVVRHGAAFITYNKVIGARLADVLRQRGRPDPPIYAPPLPSPQTSAKGGSLAGVSWRVPYFVIISTIEPRKNHLLLLNLWRELASRPGAIPKLIAVGGPGWENEQVLDMFDRCTAIRPHVLRVARLSGAALSQLVAHAQALLMPSFDEGCGIPIVEALTLGTPVIASDIPVFRDTAQGCATLLPPLNGGDWRDAILAFSDPLSPAWQEARARASRFRAPNWQDYFKGVEGFLDSL